jgi:hypothetical protein
MPDTPNSSNGGNQRVTLAEVKKDIQYLISEFEQMRLETKEYRALNERRISDLETRCLSMHSDIARLDERQKATTGILGAFTAIAATVAGVVGSVTK